MSLIQFSENESNILGIKVGRYVANQFDGKHLGEQMMDENYQLCRVTTDAANESCVVELELSEIRYFFSGGITRYKTPIASLPIREYIHSDLIFEMYDGSQKDVLYNMLKDTWGDYPLGYYRTPILRDIISKDMELDCVFEFYSHHNLPSVNPNNALAFFSHKGNYIGFFALNKVYNNLESHIGGILQPYRKDGYFYDMQVFINEYCRNNNLEHFCFGARNENRRANDIFLDYGYKPISMDYVFHLVNI